MPSPELETVKNLLRANPPVQGLTIPDMRKGMDAITAGWEPPGDVAYEPVDAGGVPAEWTTTPESETERTVVYFHGGGYTLGSIQSHRPLVTRLARESRARVLSVDYRLGPEHPHPAAVEDACTAFRFVLDGGATPGSVALAGDSAGGGLTAAALVALREAGGPQAGAGVCISPWLDLTLSGESMETRADEDPMVGPDMLRLMADAYAGDAKHHPTASPLFAELAGLPPLLVQVGTAEILLDDATRFAERAEAAGVDLELEVWDEMVHVWHAFADLLPEGRQATERIGAWLRRTLGDVA